MTQVLYKFLGKGGQVKARQISYQVLGVFDVEDVLPYIAMDDTEQYKIVDYVIDGVTWRVKMGSERIRCLQRSPRCLCCGMEGIQFQLELPPRDKRPHFNLYGMDTEGDLVMLTKDHIIPRSRGGGNHPSNLQTLCCVCNERKRDLVVTVDELRNLIKDSVENSI